MLFSAFLTTLMAFPADAGIKYWDNPAYKTYDADSYVADGLVLNYDGIRNQGLEAGHSSDATTWVNAANPGYFDLTRRNKTTPAGAWTDVGFAFTNTSSSVGAYFQNNTGYTFPAEYTLQTLIDAKVADQRNDTCTYVMFNGGNWQKAALGIRTKSDYNYGYYFVCDTAFGESTRPRIVKSSKEYTYGTAIVSGNTATFFEGTTPPTSGDLPQGYASRTASATAQKTTKLAIGGGQDQQDLTGQIKAFRLYHKALETDELAWNRVVDEARFFGRRAPLPVTNVVVASSIANVAADQPAGCYAVDADGFAFTAPSAKTVDGRTYTLAGYTLEKRDAATGAWVSDGEGVHAGATVSVTAADCVRITWQWTPGDGIVTRYTTADYVQDGLLLMYDGIRNTGVDQPHASTATVWVNLAPVGGNDLILHPIPGATDPGAWRVDGFRFEGESYFGTDASFTLPSNQTIQVTMTANALDQFARNKDGVYVNEPYFYYANGVSFNKGASLSLRKNLPADGNIAWFDWSTGDYGKRPRATFVRGVPSTYMTAVLADGYSAVFLGTAKPASATSDEWAAFAARGDFTSVPQVQTANQLSFGGKGPEAAIASNFKGTLKNIRFYNRVLEDAEIVQNRMVDDYRFFGVMPVTNVVVASSHAFLSGAERCGNYEVSGAYTFTASFETQTDARGFEYTCTGYTLEAWDAARGGWGAPVSYASCAYAYTVGTSPEKVRLTWQWAATKALFTAADYGLDDYVDAGLLLHFDGLKHLGVDSFDASSPTSTWSFAWVNLAAAAPESLRYVTRATRTSTYGADGTWGDEGYVFANKTYFEGGAMTIPPRLTHQALVDATMSEINPEAASDANPRGYVFFTDAWNKGGSWSFVCDARGNTGKNRWVDLAAHGFVGAVTSGNGATRADPTISTGKDGPFDYSSGIMTPDWISAFYGMARKTSGSRWSGYWDLAAGGVTVVATPVSSFKLGAGGAQYFSGTLKNYRLYDRALTDAELVRNRNVDSARYFGELATTNVFVVAGGGAQTETGAYKVEGTWTFTADTVADAHGDAAAVQRYWIEELVNGKWTNRQTYDGKSYTYVEGTSAATVRLTWKPQPDGTTILLR